MDFGIHGVTSNPKTRIMKALWKGFFKNAIDLKKVLDNL